MKIADMHCDTVEKLYHGYGDSLISNDLHLSVEGMRKGDYLLQNFAVFVDRKETADPTRTALEMISQYRRELGKAAAYLREARSYEEVEENQRRGRMSAVLTLEEGAVLGGRMENLQKFYDLGVRMMTLTWNYENELGAPNLMWDGEGRPRFQERSSRGLTSFGIQAVEEMERLGIIPDVSHLSDGGFLDVAAHTKKPFVASHSNAQAVCNVCRNLTDSMIRTLGERGGVAGINFCEDFLTCRTERSEQTVMEAVVAHIRHMVDAGGIEVCALGSDFDGIEGNRAITGARDMQKLVYALEKAGFLPSQIEKICSGNVLRVYRETL